MDPHTPAEELPSLYRAILDRIAALEAAGQRADAVRIRRDATRAYSRAWAERARRELEALLRRASAPTAAERLLGRGRREGRGLRRSRQVVSAPDV
jgi:phage-related minor tail protein